jgi:hypothetical protein
MLALRALGGIDELDPRPYGRLLNAGPPDLCPLALRPLLLALGRLIRVYLR